MSDIPASVLVVDDQPDNLRTLSAILRAEGYKVRTAVSGEVALETVSSQLPDLILLDIRMPNMDGYAVCSTLKAAAATRKIPVIFLSALDDKADKVKAFAAGGADYITKPFQAEEVLVRIEHQLTIWQQQQQLEAQNRQLQQEIAERQRAEALVQQQAKREKLLGVVIQQIRQSLELDEILNITVLEVRQLLQVNCVQIYRCHPDCSSEIVAESVSSESLSIQGQTLDNPSRRGVWSKRVGDRGDKGDKGDKGDSSYQPTTYDHTRMRECESNLYKQSGICAIADIYTSTLAPDYMKILASLQVRASLVLPISQPEKTWGLLVAHQCWTPRAWEQWELDFLQQLAAQLAIAIQQSELYQQVQQLNTFLEDRVRERTAQLQQALEFESLLKRITDKVRDSLEEKQILQAAVEELAVGLELECCHTNIYDVHLQISSLVHESKTAAHSVTGCLIECDATGVNSQLNQRQAVQFCWYQPDEVQSVGNQHTILACPIFDDHGILGDLWLFKPKEKIFDELELRLVKQVVNQCAIAVRQARLYEKAQMQVKELKRLNWLKDEFLSTISHELRTPIANIKMTVQLLMVVTDKAQNLPTSLSQSETHDQKVAQYLKILQNECDRELQLIQDLLDLQHLDANQYHLELTTVNLHDWIPHLLEPMEIRVRDQKQTLQVHLPRHLPIVTTDLSSLSRILSELLDNACKYTPPGGTITLAVEEDTKIRLSVTNTGVEIPAEELPRIYDKFYRIPNNDPWKYGGTGLGLALVKRLVEYLAGSIWVKSANGQTSFTVELPIEPLA